MKRLKTVIIGMGRMGKMRFEKMQQHGGFEVTGVCDEKPENLQQYTVPSFTNWKDCINQCDCQVVVVCTINSVIPDVVCYALEQGKHVFSEKPPGRNLQDTLKMQEAAKRHKECVLKFGFNHRYHNSVIEAKALIASGLLGDIVCARGVYGKAGSPTFASEWRNNVALSGGGILLDQGIHMMDLLRYFLGDFTEIQSSVDTLVWKEMTTEDSAFAIFRTADGKMASLHSNALQWRHKFDLDIICSKGYIALNGLITSTNSYGEERISYYKKDLNAQSGSLGKPLEHTLYFDTDRSWEYEHEEFYDAVVNEKPIVNGTIEDAVKVMAMIDSIYQDNKN